MTDLGGSWWLLQGTFINSVDQTCNIIISLDNGSGVVYNGDGVSGDYVWGFQTEVGSSVSPYQSDDAIVTSAVVSLTGLANTSHTLTVTVDTPGISGVVLTGVECNLTTPGVRVHRIGSPGAQAGTYANLGGPRWQSDLAVLHPNVVVLPFGINELQGGVDPAAQAYNLSTLIDRIRLAAPLASIALLTPPQPGVTGLYTMDQYAYAQYTLAQSKSVGFVNAGLRMGPFPTTSALGLWITASPTIHVNIYGGAAVSSALLTYLNQ
jgi:hypothetical protein